MFLNVAPSPAPARAAGLGAVRPRPILVPRVRGIGSYRRGRGLGSIDFGGGFDSYGRAQVIAPLVPSGQLILSTVNGMANKQMVPTLAMRLSQTVPAWETANPEQVVAGKDGGDTLTPETARTALTDMATNHCWLYAEACAGVDVQGLVNSLLDNYNRWRNSAIANYYDMVASGATAPVPGVWAQPPAGYTPYVPKSGIIPVVSGDQAALDFFGHPPATSTAPVVAVPPPVSAPAPVLVSRDPAYPPVTVQSSPVDTVRPPAASAPPVNTPAPLPSIQVFMPAPAAAPAAAPASSGALDFLSQKFTIAGYDIPVVGAIAAVGLALYLFGGSGGRGRG
jgi:hypothetical protein